MSQSPLPKTPPKSSQDYKARFGVVPNAPQPKMTRLQARRAKRKRFRLGMVVFALLLGTAAGTAFLIGQDFNRIGTMMQAAFPSQKSAPAPAPAAPAPVAEAPPAPAAVPAQPAAVAENSPPPSPVAPVDDASTSEAPVVAEESVTPEPVTAEPVTPEPEAQPARSEEHTSDLQSRSDLGCRLLLEKKKDAAWDPRKSPRSVHSWRDRRRPELNGRPAPCWGVRLLVESDRRLASRAG